MSSLNKAVVLLIAFFVALSSYLCFHRSLSIAGGNLRPAAGTAGEFYLPGGVTSLPSNATITIKVLAYDRIESLSRCLHSLAGADYGHDRVDLHIFIDHFKEFTPQQESENLNRKIQQSHQIWEFADRFFWRYGEKFLLYRTVNAGLQAQWLEAWWPRSDDDFVFMVEDDVEVSPLYYRYLRRLISTYYYKLDSYSSALYGASLQRPRFVAGKHGNKLHVENTTRLFLYQMVGTWGQLLFPRPWKEFRLWYDVHKAKQTKPVIQGMVTSGWYKKMGEKIWTPWFIKFIHSHGYYNIHTNFLQERALSISHRDAGVNYGRRVGPDSNLLEEAPMDINLWEMQPLKNLKWYDFCFEEVIPNRVAQSISDLGVILQSVQEQGTIILLNLFRTAEPLIKHLLCHIERLNIHNYILIGAEARLLVDLARRGHAVIEAEALISDIHRHNLIDLTGLEDDFLKEIIVKGIVIRKCLEFDYSSWVIDGNMVPLEAFMWSIDHGYDLLVGEDMELILISSTHAMTMMWTYDFICNIAEKAKSSTNRSSLLDEQKHFAIFVAHHLEGKGLQIKKVDEQRFVVRLVTNNLNETLKSGKMMMVYWSYALNLDYIQRRLEGVGLWALDEDFSCSAVVCHQS